VDVGEAPASAVVGELFNAGTGADVSIGQLAADIARLMGVDADISEDPRRLRPKDSEVLRLCCDAGRLRDRTGWQPRFTREQGLEKTIEWFQRPGNLDRYNPNEYSQ
jgi:nucleoside-diphosphate-sugar epimerase